MEVKFVSPENLVQFKGLQDETNAEAFAPKDGVPTKVSQLQNDSGYQTQSQVSALISAALSSVLALKGTVSSTDDLPDEGSKVGDVWIVTGDGSEWVWGGSSWEELGHALDVTWSSITGKPSTFPPTAHTHTRSEVTDFPSSMPASDVSAWAKSPTKPSYTADEVGAAEASHSHAPMSGASSSEAGSSGFVPAPAAGKQGSYLRGDGTWQTPANTTYSEATTSKSGLMSAADKAKLDGVAPGATAYAHPTSPAGSKASGLYKIATDTSGHVTSASAVAKSDITDLGIPAQDTTYQAATQGSAGLMSAADKAKLDGVASGANAYEHPTSAAGSKASGLYKVATDADGHVTSASPVAKSDITALGIPSTNTTYSNATSSASGLMSAADKARLDGMPDMVAMTEAEITALFQS